jgi:hypothetical protein
LTSIKNDNVKIIDNNFTQTPLRIAQGDNIGSSYKGLGITAKISSWNSQQAMEPVLLITHNCKLGRHLLNFRYSLNGGIQYCRFLTLSSGGS